MKKKRENNSWMYIKFLEDWVNHASVRYFMYILLGISMYLLLMGQVIPKTYELKQGENSPIDLSSRISVIDEYDTNLQKEAAAKAVGEVYIKDPDVLSNQLKDMDEYFDNITSIINEKDVLVKDKVEKITQLDNNILSEESIKLIASLSVDKINNIKYISKTTLDVMMNTGVRYDDLNSAYQKAEEMIKDNPYDNGEKIKNIAFEMTKHFIKPNYFYDAKQTITKRQEAKDNVQPIIIKKDELIVKQGQYIDQSTNEKLKAAGLLKDTSTLWPYFGLLLIVGLLAFLLFYSIERMKPRLHKNNKSLLMLFIIILLTITSISILGMVGGNSLTSPIGFLAPVAFGVMLITLLISLRFAILSGAIFSIFASLMFNFDQTMIFDFRYGFVLLMGSTAGAFAIGRVKQRSSILKAGIIVALFNVLSILVIIMLTNQSFTFRDGLEMVIYGVIGGIFSSVLTIGFLPFFETVFGILSPINLIELSNPNHPLLRKLLIETPGTYHHSIIVGNLAESAAETIGANGLLARVGAYYHDLGKTKRPTFFIENQLNMENPHDNIAPSLSKKIIISHTKDGVEMLKEHKLPHAIQDIAQQHHGTTLLKYFYYKALKETDEEIPESEYRYPGPKPQTKEAAIVGIADSIEAAVRSLSKPTNESIEEMVRKIIKSKLDDGQLNECDLTLKELEIVAISMLETIKGIFHSRIEYPDENVEEHKGVKTS